MNLAPLSASKTAAASPGTSLGEIPARTLEEILRFDSGLTAGEHRVTLVVDRKQERPALVKIHRHGAVLVLVQPTEADMYTRWWRVRGNRTTAEGDLILWGARDPVLLARFANPVARITLSIAQLMAVRKATEAATR